MTVRIEHYQGLDNTPALSIALRGQWECAEAGGEQAVGLHYSYNAILAVTDDKPVGVIVWHEQKEQHRLWLQLGYMLPEYRGRGIYSLLWNELLAKARELKHAEIWSATAMGNTRMRNVARKQGRIEVAVSLRYRLESDAVKFPHGALRADDWRVTGGSAPIAREAADGGRIIPSCASAVSALAEASDRSQRS